MGFKPNVHYDMEHLLIILEIELSDTSAWGLQSNNMFETMISL